MRCFDVAGRVEIISRLRTPLLRTAELVAKSGPSEATSGPFAEEVVVPEPASSASRRLRYGQPHAHLRGRAVAIAPSVVFNRRALDFMNLKINLDLRTNRAGTPRVMAVTDSRRFWTNEKTASLP